MYIPPDYPKIKELIEKGTVYEDIQDLLGCDRSYITQAADHYNIQRPKSKISDQQIIDKYLELGNGYEVAKFLHISTNRVYSTLKAANIPLTRQGGDTRKDTPGNPFKTDELSYYWLGWLAVRGNFRTKSEIQIHISSTHLRESYCSLINKKATTSAVAYRDESLVNWLKSLGIDEQRKSPFDNSLLVPAFIRGIFDSPASQIKNGEVIMTFLSESRACQVQSYLTQNEVTCLVYRSRKTGVEEDIHCVKTYSDKLEQFEQLVYKSPCSVFNEVKRLKFTDGTSTN